MVLLLFTCCLLLLPLWEYVIVPFFAVLPFNVTKFCWKMILYTLTNKLYGPRIGVLYAWMNCYGTLLHKITPGIYIVIKDRIEFICTEQQQKHQQQQQQQQQQKYYNINDFDFKRRPNVTLIGHWCYNTLTNETNSLLNVWCSLCTPPI